MFNGYHFYFYPSTDVSRINQIRSRIVAKQGATITSEINAQTSHILVRPQSVNQKFYDNVLNPALKINKNITVLDSDWVSESVAGKKIMNTDGYVVTANQHVQDEIAHPVEKSGSNDNDLETVKKRRSTSYIDQCNKKSKQLSEDIEFKYREASEDDDDVDRKNSQFHQTDETSEQRDLYETLSIPKSELNSVVNALEQSIADKSRNGHSNYSKTLNGLYDIVVKAKNEALRERRRSVDLKLSPENARNISYLTRASQTKWLQAVKERSDTIKLFMSVYGIGEYTANKFFSKGYRSLQDIFPFVDENGRVSITHHSDFVERISREEVEEHFTQVKSAAAELDKDIQLYCMGSYRRGCRDCGDIDIIFTMNQGTIMKIKSKFEILLEKMFKEKLAVYTFTKGSGKWLGATQVNSKWRRMDILLVPWQELGAATLYYTGSGEFNRMMRSRAIKMNMKLNQTGLFTATKGEEPHLLESFNESKIFTILGLPWIEPSKR